MDHRLTGGGGTILLLAPGAGGANGLNCFKGTGFIYYVGYFYICPAFYYSTVSSLFLPVYFFSSAKT